MSAIAEQERLLANAKRAFLAEFDTRPGQRPGAEAVLVDAALRTPSFQLDASGEVLPVVAEVVAALRASGLRGWQIILWFTSSNGWLDAARPVDLLGAESARVVAAVQQVGNFPY